MKLRTLLVNLAALLITSLVITAVSARELCETVVRDAWELVTENCEGIDNDNVCYGHESLNATFNVSDPALSFSRPGDQNTLQNLHTIRTQAFDEGDEEWGISDFQIPAENFGGTADQNVIIFTTGDVIVENAVEVGSDQAAMSAFNFTTGGSSDCREAPNTVFIQSPRDLKVNLQINSTPMRIGSTIVLGTDVDPETGFDVMWFGVIEGSLTLYPDTPQEQVIPAGGFTTTLLSNQQGQGLDDEAILNAGLVPVLDRVTGEPILAPGGEPFYRQAPIVPFTEPQAITLSGEGYAGWGAYQFVNLIPTALLIYDVQVPEVNQLADDSGTSASKPNAMPQTSAPALVTNWCAPGGKWDDGRCDNADPFVSDWYWNAGWYNAALENGLIDSIPSQYQQVPATSTPNPQFTATSPATAVLTNTPTTEFTNTPTNSPTFTPTNTFTPSFTPTFTLTPSLTFTPSETPLPAFDANITDCALQPDTTYNITITMNYLPATVDYIRIYDSVAYTDQFVFPTDTTINTNRDAAELPLTGIEPRDVNDVVLVYDGALGTMPPCS